MNICEIDAPGVYVVNMLGTQFTLEVAPGRRGELWAENTCFITRPIDEWNPNSERELRITGPDDRYHFQPVTEIEGTVLTQILEYQTNNEV